MDEPFQVPQVSWDRVRDRAFEVGPDELIRIKLGRVAREAMKAQPVGCAQEFADQDAAMLIDVVPDDEYRPPQPLEQLAQESDDIGRADVAVAEELGV